MVSPMLLNEMLAKAAALRQAGRYAEAADGYQRLLSLAPELPTAWYNLGFCLRRCGRFEQALAAYQRAIEGGLSEAEEVHLNRSVILMDHLNREEEAERELRRALALNPNYAPALLNLANLAEDRGRRTEAAETYERLLEAEPSCWEGLARYSRLRAASGNVPAAILARLREAVARNDVPIDERVSLGFALGDVLDRSGDYDAAFEAYARANSDMRQTARGRYDANAEAALLQEIMDTFPGAGKRSQSHDWSPIFICGMFRSGSTMAEQVLSGHPLVTPCGELGLIPRLVHGVLAPYPQQLHALRAHDYARLAASYRADVRKLFPQADLVTDKRPENYLHIGLIKRMFPRAKIIHTKRHPIDNMLSIYFLHLDESMAYATDLTDIAAHYKLYHRLMSHWERSFPGDIFRFDYDAFVRNPIGESRKLTDFLGLEWSEECLKFHERSNLVKTASVWQVREPLYDRSSGRWKNYERHLGGVMEYLSDLV